MHRSSARPEDQLTFRLEVLDETSRDSQAVSYLIIWWHEKKHLDAHRLSFKYEYIFCKGFPHKILAVDVVRFCACDRYKHESVRHTVWKEFGLYYFCSRTSSCLWAGHRSIDTWLWFECVTWPVWHSEGTQIVSWFTFQTLFFFFLFFCLPFFVIPGLFLLVTWARYYKEAPFVHMP